VAVEGINNYNGLLIPSKIYDEVIVLSGLSCCLLFDEAIPAINFAGYCTTSTSEKGQICDRYSMQFSNTLVP
jgi:hypothetical protein